MKPNGNRAPGASVLPCAGSAALVRGMAVSEPGDQAGLDRLCLARLERSMTLAAAAGRSPLRRRLAWRTARVAYRDCLALGLRSAAGEIVGRVVKQLAPAPEPVRLARGCRPSAPP